jgi:hypothetical protein
MTRHALRITILLGVLITLVGGTGIFAAFTDTATTGTNNAVTGPRPQAVDLKIESALLDVPVNCDGDANATLFDHDDLTTGIFDVSGVQPGDYPADAAVAYVCLFNAGSAAIEVGARASDVVDTDTGCTGDEAGAGDLTCGADQAGELSGYLAAQMEQLDCDTAASVPLQANSIADWADLAEPVPLSGPLQPGDIACLAFYLWLPSSTDETALQVIQSDGTSWRFAFDAALAP